MSGGTYIAVGRANLRDSIEAAAVSTRSVKCGSLNGSRLPLVCLILEGRS